MLLDFDSGDSYTVSSALHEFGHALGFSHDHVQKDKADFVCKTLHPEVTTHAAKPGDVYMAEQRGSQSIMSYCPIFGQMWRSITADDVRGVQKHYGAGPGGPLTKAGDARGSAAGCPEKFRAAGGFGKAFLHVFDNTCWACPNGANRTVNPNVGGNRACGAPARESEQPASDHGPGKGLLKTDCGPAQFLDVAKGRCYDCPSGYRRSLAPVTAGNACVKTEPAVFTAAGKLGHPGAPRVPSPTA